MALLFTILVLGLLASLSPSTIVVFILLLATKRAGANGAAFLVGWSLSLVVVFVGSYLVALRERLVAAGPTRFAAVSFAVGLLLVADGTLSLLTA